MAVKQMWRSCKILMSWIPSRKKSALNPMSGFNILFLLIK